MIRILLLLRSSSGALDRVFRVFVPVLALGLLNGCSSLGYYGQLASGQLQLLGAREPVPEVIANPATDPALRQHLQRSQQARVFASEHLKLPDNRSYRVYADIGRPYVVWNVFATPEFSLDPRTHCFPIAGCVAYRGYYSQSGARGAAALLKLEGQDVYVGGVEAYSTLGWFDDPILNSMLGWGDERLATVIFHELAHQRFYVKDDTAFNESSATFVGQEGTRQWRAAGGCRCRRWMAAGSATSLSPWCWRVGSGSRRCMRSRWRRRRCVRPSRRSSNACGRSIDSCETVSGAVSDASTHGSMGR
mgnify:CR=1 FL=1